MLTPSEAFGSKNVDVIVKLELVLLLVLDVELVEVELLDVVETLEVEVVVELETVLLDVMLVLVEVLLTEVLLLVVLVWVTVEVVFPESESSDALAVELFEDDPSTAFGPVTSSSEPLRPSPRPVMLLSLADCGSSLSSTVCVMVVVTVVVTSSSLPTHCCMHRSVSSESRPYLELQETKHRHSCSSPKDALPPGKKSSKFSSSKAYW